MQFLPTCFCRRLVGEVRGESLEHLGHLLVHEEADEVGGGLAPGAAGLYASGKRLKSFQCVCLKVPGVPLWSGSLCVLPVFLTGRTGV